MGHKDGLDDGEITHGICRNCYALVLAQLKELKK
jgi:hypothetical protein